MNNSSRIAARFNTGKPCSPFARAIAAMRQSDPELTQYATYLLQLKCKSGIPSQIAISSQWPWYINLTSLLLPLVVP